MLSIGFPVSSNVPGLQDQYEITENKTGPPHTHSESTNLGIDTSMSYRPGNADLTTKNQYPPLQCTPPSAELTMYNRVGESSKQDMASAFSRDYTSVALQAK